MIPVESPHPPGLLGLSAGEQARYHAFTGCWSVVHVPPGSHPLLALGYSTAYNSNDICHALIASNTVKGWTPEIAKTLHADKWEWAWIMDDDHTFPHDLLLNLLDRRVDVVVPLYTQRQPPYAPVAYKTQYPDGSCDQYQWPELAGRTGLLPVASAGKGGVLIRRRVLETIPAPWFENRGEVGEDHLFFQKCAKAGFQVYVDLDNQMGHITPVEIRPRRTSTGEWCGAVNLGRDQIVEVFTQPKPSPASAGGYGAPSAAPALNAV